MKHLKEGKKEGTVYCEHCGRYETRGSSCSDFLKAPVTFKPVRARFEWTLETGSEHGEWLECQTSRQLFGLKLELRRLNGVYGANTHRLLIEDL